MSLSLLALLSLVASPAETPAVIASPEQAEAVAEEVVAWVNDEVIVLSELKAREKETLAQKIGEKKVAQGELSSQIEEVRKLVLTNLITARLLIQEAEGLYDLDKVRPELLKDFKDRNEIKSDEELDRMLRQYRMTREDLVDQLVMDYIPSQVLRMQTMSDLGVSETEARDYYQRNLDRFRVPGQVTFRELVLKADTPARLESRRQEAADLAARAKGAEDFSALVRELSEGPSKVLDGKIGPVQLDDIVPALREAVSSIPVGAVSDPVSTALGWAILKVEERRDTKTATFEEARVECEEAVRREKNGPAIEKYVQGRWKEATIEVRKEYLDRLAPAQRALVRER